MDCIGSLGEVTCIISAGAGKLGHGDTSRIYKPKVIEAVAGTHIRKVVCSGQSSTALSFTGQVTLSGFSIDWSS